MNVLCFNRVFNIEFKQESHVTVDDLPETKEIGMFLGRVLMKEYPYPGNISGYRLDDLLKWDLWPSLLSACGNFPFAIGMQCHSVLFL